MRFIAIIAVGFGILPTIACGSSNNGTAKAGAGAKCTTNANCQSGLCIAEACTAPTSGSGGFPSSGGFGGSPVGSGGELSASGGSIFGSGGSIFGSGGSILGSGGVIGASGDSGTVPSGGSSGDSGTVKDGQAPPPPVDGGRPPKPGGGEILCDQATCKNRDVCCGSAAQGMGNAPMYACSPDACNQGDTAISCDGYEDCSGSQKCCLTTAFGGPGGGGATTYTCADQCAGVDVQCTSTKNCNGGEVCCETVGMFGASKTACETGTGCQNSPPAMNPMEYQLCEANADCPQGTQCTQSTNLPGFRICK